MLAHLPLYGSVGRSIWHRRAEPPQRLPVEVAWQAIDNNREGIALSNSVATATVLISTRKQGDNARVRVMLETRSSLPQVGEDKITKAAQGAGIPAQGVSHNPIGRYFELILRPGSRLPRKDTDAATRLKENVLSALSAIYGEKFSFKLPSSSS